ncbi:MAG: hypothetical protein JRJ57_01700 [Deltaproteobacteria bacterium]|nr:hypothetical protein [Deltaproteobacteria bacterium]
MCRDFTIKLYKKLLESLLDEGFYFIQVAEYDANKEIRKNAKSFVVLRQDVDRLPANSLVFARIQKELGIRSTFYFRSVPHSFQEEIIKEISALGHDIGYHYEDFVFARQKTKGQRQKNKAQGTEHRAKTEDRFNNEFERELAALAIASFEGNLEKFRKIIPVKSICMHGSPMSKWDSRILWKYYDYREFGIEVEPYFDMNFEEMLYLTDTGRRWNGQKYIIRDKPVGSSFAKATEDRGWDGSRVSVRDKAEGQSKDKRQKTKDKSKKEKGKNIKEELQSTEDPFKDWVVKPVLGSLMNMTTESSEFQARYNYRSTNAIIKAAERGELPDRIMMTFHPQRWTDQAVPWVKELVWQNTKNVAKFFLIKIRQ